MEKENVNTHISNGNPECTQFAYTFDIFINEIRGFQCHIILQREIKIIFIPLKDINA